MVRPPHSPHKGPPCLLPHPRGRACQTAALPIAHNHFPRRIRPRNAWALGDLKARSVRWTSTTPRVLAATPVMRARWPHRGNQMAQQQKCCRHTEDSPSRSPRHPAGPPGPSPGSGHTKTSTQCWTAWQPRLRLRTLMMKLTFLGHRGGARVPPEYVDKFPSPIDCVSCSGTLHSTCSEKSSGVHPACIQHRCPHPAVWFPFGPYLRIFRPRRQLCVESEPRCSAPVHDFASSPFFNCDLATCSQRRLKGPNLC